MIMAMMMPKRRAISFLGSLARGLPEVLALEEREGARIMLHLKLGMAGGVPSSPEPKVDSKLKQAQSGPVQEQAQSGPLNT
jgi:hypothetical protein